MNIEKLGTIIGTQIFIVGAAISAYEYFSSSDRQIEEATAAIAELQVRVAAIQRSDITAVGPIGPRGPQGVPGPQGPPGPPGESALPQTLAEANGIDGTLAELQQRVSVLEAELSTSQGSPRVADTQITQALVAGRANATPPDFMFITPEGIAVELERCERAVGDDVECDFLAVNNSSNPVEFCIGGNNLAITDTGHETNDINFWVPAGQGGRQACHTLQASVFIRGVLDINLSGQSQLENNVQYLRFACGTGCTYEGRSIPVRP